ncbi:MAG: hypothetical protein HYT30_01700 [Parcubacteria group bacterium]|nr:hypothetical protein [Parcubacteria group bacterium]
MAKEVKILTQDDVGKYVRILRSWYDKNDRQHPELYEVIDAQGPTLIGAIQKESQNVSVTGDDTYLVLTKKEAMNYLNECHDCAMQISNFLVEQQRVASIRAHECSMASIRMLQ